MKQAKPAHGLAIAVAFSFLALPSNVSLGEELSARSFRVSGHVLKNMVSRAGRIAVEKLDKQECQMVLSDFQDGNGSPLGGRLEALGVSASEYFVQLTFIDGSAWSRCGDGSAAAGTNRGGAVVAVCPKAFDRVLVKNPSLAADLLIHEMLHGLGLGENPPTSEEVTLQVVKRCGL